MKKIDWAKVAFWLFCCVIMLALVGYGFGKPTKAPPKPAPPTEAQVVQLMKMYTDKFNRQQKQINELKAELTKNAANDKQHIEDATRWQLPMVGGTK